MTLPTLAFGSLLAIFYGVIFHLWRGGSIWKLISYIALSLIGFWLGEFIGGKFGFKFYQLGALHLGFATIFSLILMAGGYWLTKTDSNDSD